MTDQSFEQKLLDDKTPLTDIFKPEDWMTPKEVADLFQVKSRTILRWMEKPEMSRVRSYKTPGGHRRFYKQDVHNILLEQYEDAKDARP